MQRENNSLEGYTPAKMAARAAFFVRTIRSFHPCSHQIPSIRVQPTKSRRECCPLAKNGVTSRRNGLGKRVKIPCSPAAVSSIITGSMWPLTPFDTKGFGKASRVGTSQKTCREASAKRRETSHPSPRAMLRCHAPRRVATVIPKIKGVLKIRLSLF